MKNSKIQINSNKDDNIIDFSTKFKNNKINNIFYLKKLNLQKFRNHLNLNLILSDSPILIYGENGCGKTNILEAISLLGPGKGLRKSKSEDYLLKNISSNEENRLWGVNADLQTPSGNINIGTGSLQKSLKKSRNMRINFENSSQSSVGEILKISWVTPQMCMLFQLSMSERRRFIDRLTSTLDSSHINRVFRYEKLIRERSNIIFQFKNETIWLNAIEKKISELSVCIAASRLNLILELDNLYEEETRNGSLIKDFPPAKIELKGDIENLLIRNSAIHVEDQIQQILKKGNIKNDTSFNGPHTTQVNIINRNNGKQVEISSTGEQKLILISIILSHARMLNIKFNMPPILLLDDIIEHLDEKHRHALFLEVSKHFAQSWFTSTNKEPFEKFPNIINKIFLPKVMNNNKGYYDYRNGDV
ncbi:AAA family ATPase [Alphaproteobacteria bacterium]|nr:AAA family ATPase [Alphaproteobacteria bacterium]